MHSFTYEILSWTKSRSSSKWLLLNVVFCFVWKATTWQKGVEREILTLKREEGRSKKYKLRKGKRKTPFSGENRGGPLPTLAIGQSREISLNYWQMGTCSLDLGSSWFGVSMVLNICLPTGFIKFLPNRLQLAEVRWLLYISFRYDHLLIVLFLCKSNPLLPVRSLK